MRRYVLGANIIEHVTNSNTVIRRSFRNAIQYAGSKGVAAIYPRRQDYILAVHSRSIGCIIHHPASNRHIWHVPALLSVRTSYFGSRKVAVHSAFHGDNSVRSYSMSNPRMLSIRMALSLSRNQGDEGILCLADMAQLWVPATQTRFRVVGIHSSRLSQYHRTRRALLSPTWKPSTRGLRYVWPLPVWDPDPPVWRPRVQGC